MKKILVIALVMLLAVPVMVFAQAPSGSATSRWNLTIGGQVKFDMGYNTQGIGSGYHNALRDDYTGNKSADNEAGNYFMGAGESNINFLVRGPDAFGAKTSAFIQGDFTGAWSGTTYGTFNLAAANIRLDWKDTQLFFGQAASFLAAPGTHAGNTLYFNAVTPFNKGTPNTMQVTVTHNFTKDLQMKLALLNPGGQLGATGGTTATSNFSRSELPFVAADFSVFSDACGRVGPFRLLFSVAGMYGQEKIIYTSQAAAAGVKQRVGSKSVDSWLVQAETVIPIIPEKKGNKTGAMFTAFSAFTGQNADGHLNLPVTYTGAFARVATAGRGFEYAAPVITGGFGHIAYYFTDTLWVNGLYGYYKVDWSGRLNAAIGGVLANTQNTAHVSSNQQIIGNILYNASPALRVGFEYVRTDTIYRSYNELAAGIKQFTDRKGVNNMFRVGAWYFF